MKLSSFNVTVYNLKKKRRENENKNRKTEKNKYIYVCIETKIIKKNKLRYYIPGNVQTSAIISCFKLLFK